MAREDAPPSRAIRTICPPVGLILSEQVAAHRQQLAYSDIETQYTDVVHTANTW